jgi:hypothetical protein
LDVHIASHVPSCKGIPAVISSDDCGIYVKVLDPACTLASL